MPASSSMPQPSISRGSADRWGNCGQVGTLPGHAMGCLQQRVREVRCKPAACREEQQWLVQRMEAQEALPAELRRSILRQVVHTDVLEHFLAAKFPKTKAVPASSQACSLQLAGLLVLCCLAMLCSKFIGQAAQWAALLTVQCDLLELPALGPGCCLTGSNAAPKGVRADQPACCQAQQDAGCCAEVWHRGLRGAAARPARAGGRAGCPRGPAGMPLRWRTCQAPRSTAAPQLLMSCL